MGCFNWIDYECECPECGALVNSFQSKDGPCDMTKLRPWEVEHFYGECPGCKKKLHLSLTETAKTIRDFALQEAYRNIDDVRHEGWFKIEVREDF
jgi:hypothetical protein